MILTFTFVSASAAKLLILVNKRLNNEMRTQSLMRSLLGRSNCDYMEMPLSF